MNKLKLNEFFELIRETVIKNQNAITGLIPASEADSHAWVRDNCYAVLSIWGLSLAYRKIPDLDEDRCKGYELEKCAIKLMRGLLTCFMKQASKVEKFKSTQRPSDCLHAKYDSRNCNTVVQDNEWGHLQIDAISLYLLTVAQMTASGLHIIWTHDEVSFIQNLVFYIEMAYRIPDYGIWERGDKTNHGLPELNTSSVGMAKAALEALSDLDLFGPHGGPRSVIQSFPDECQQCNAVLESMLPRESYSKELDSALLSILSYPAFAVNDDELIETTREEIIRNLLGRYGCKRFFRDGFRTPVEDPHRLHYEPHELRMFDKIECEWPMFFSYLALDACFRDDRQMAVDYIARMEAIMVELDRGGRSFKVVPENYAVTTSTMEAEIAQPGSQTRLPRGKTPHVWGQSLYVLSKLVVDGIITTGEIDPLGRRMLLEPKPDLVVQVSVMVETDEFRDYLLEHNIVSQTGQQLFNETKIKVYPARTLIHILKGLGKCDALKLNGRVCKEVGTLATSRLYLIGQHMVAFQPQFMDTKDFYVSLDYDFIVDVFRSNVAYLRRVWSNPGRPTLIIPIFNRFFKSDGTLEKSILTTLMKLKSGYIYGTRVKLGKLADFVSTSFVTKLSFLHDIGDDVVKQLTPNVTSPKKIEALRHGSVLESNNFKSLAIRRKSVALTNAILVDLEGNDNYNNNEVNRSFENITGERNPEEELHTLKPTNVLKRSDKHELKSSAAHLKNLVNSGGGVDHNRDHSPSLESQSPLQRMTNDQLLTRLQETNDIGEQGEVLFILWQREGLNWEAVLYDGETYSIKQILIEFYDKAGEECEWWLVRFISGLLGKRVDVLDKSLTDLLIRQKQVSVGLPPEPREIVISSPMAPHALSELIQRACGEDYAMTMLSQEILVYLAMFARTEPQLLAQMLRLRVGLIIQVMASELARALHCNAAEASSRLYDLSPSQTKLLLQHILAGREFTLATTKRERRKSGIQSHRVILNVTNMEGQLPEEDGFFSGLGEDGTGEPGSETSNNRIGQWIRRRKIDGALNRVPFKFYQKLWKVIDRIQNIRVGDRNLNNNLTREMTKGELKFALVVESTLNRVPNPEYRQMLVEALSVLSHVIELDPDGHAVQLDSVIEMDLVVARANQLFLEDQAQHDGDSVLCCASPSVAPASPRSRRSSLVCKGANSLCIHFYDTSPSGRYGTMTYLLRALSERIVLPDGKSDDSSIDCAVQ